MNNYVCLIIISAVITTMFWQNEKVTSKHTFVNKVRQYYYTPFSETLSAGIQCEKLKRKLYWIIRCETSKQQQFASMITD
jgi:hypothetical protein